MHHSPRPRWLPILFLVCLGSAQADTLTSDYLVGTWEADVVEFGQRIQIRWQINADGTTDYKLRVGGQAQVFSSTWRLGANGVFYEEGTHFKAICRIRRVDAMTMELTILDSSDSRYNSFVRAYRREGPY